MQVTLKPMETQLKSLLSPCMRWQTHHSQGMILEKREAHSLAQLREDKPLPSSSHLLNLSPVLDSTACLLRVGGRLLPIPSVDTETIHSVVLDSMHKITQIIHAFDKQLRHSGAEHVLDELQRQYWILQGQEAVRWH